MTMPLSVEWKLITSGREHRLAHEENMFQIQFDGYRLFPINQVIDIQRYPDSEQIGSGKVVELTWRSETTYCKYKLLSLQNMN